MTFLAELISAVPSVWGVKEPRQRRSPRALALVSQACRNRGLDFIVGGAVSIDALASMQRFKAIHLDHFENRKVVFSGSALDSLDLAKALRQAVHFELL